MSGEDPGPGAAAAELISNLRQHNGHEHKRLRGDLYDALVMVTGLSVAIIVTIAFIVILKDRYVISDLRERVDINYEVNHCDLVLSNRITEAQHVADNAQNRLVVMFARQLISDTPPDFRAFLFAVDALDTAEVGTDKAIETRSLWLEKGSPLPCPPES